MSSKRPRAFTLVELLVVIGIIAVLISMLLPALRRARDEANRVYCRTQLRQLTMAALMYANEHKGYLPGPHGIVDPPSAPGDYVNGVTPTDHEPVSTGWLWTSGCLKNSRVWLCPADLRLPQGVTFSYTYNMRLCVKPGHDLEDNPPLLDDPFLRKITTFKETSRDILFAEENILLNLPYPINDAFFVYDDETGDRHMGQCEVAYLDGHSDDMPPKILLWRDRRYYPR
jgi:prepilin-type N-terminal cleavage/methylation domain-containing protein